MRSLRDQLVQQRHEERAVGARLDRDPLVGDRRVAGAHRVDRDEAAARALELRDRDLQRVRVMVLGGADHHEQLGALEVRPAEFPEAAADRVDHAGGHVHRAEAAVRRVVRRAELAREQAGQRLHLVAAGEERELLRVGGADPRQPLVEDREGTLPRDRLELAGAALAARLAQQRLRQPRRRHLLHDPRGALGADHARLIGWFGIAVDVAQLAVAQMHADAAAAGAHVAGGRLDLVHRLGRGRSERVVDRLSREEFEQARLRASGKLMRPAIVRDARMQARPFPQGADHDLADPRRLQPVRRAVGLQRVRHRCRTGRGRARGRCRLGAARARRLRRGDRQRRELPSGRRGQSPSAGAAGLRPPRPAHRPGGLPSLLACADGQVPRRGVGVAVRARHQAGPLGGERRGAVPAQPGRVRHDLPVDHDLGLDPAARARDRAVAGAEGQALQRRLRRARPAAGRASGRSTSAWA